MTAKPLSVVALFGTRPELIKLFPVLERIERDERFRLEVVCTAQHREMIDGLLELFSIKPDHDLGVIRENQSLADITTRTLAGLDPILRDLRPDLMLVQGDTTSAFVGALAAYYHAVTVGHVEAGLRSGDKFHPFPEEINRRLISALGDLHFAPLPADEENLLREGIPRSRVFVTGNTVIDALLATRERHPGALDDVLPAELRRGRRLVLMTAHRRESFDGHLAELCAAVRTLVDRYEDLLLVYPVHFNPNVREIVMPLLGGHDRIKLLDPLPYETFVAAMAESTLIITDSGGVQEEAPSLGKPVLVFRKVTERDAGLITKNAKLVGLDREALVSLATRLLDDPAAYDDMTRERDVYGDGRAAERIIDAILFHFGRAERPLPFRGYATVN